MREKFIFGLLCLFEPRSVSCGALGSGSVRLYSVYAYIHVSEQ